MSGKGDNFGILWKLWCTRKKICINCSKAKTKFALVYIIMDIIVISLLTEDKSLSLKLRMETSTFQLNLLLLIYILMSIVKNFVITCLRLIYIGVLEFAIFLMTYLVGNMFQMQQKI